MIDRILIKSTRPADAGRPALNELVSRFDASFARSELSFRYRSEYDPRVNALVLVERFPKLKRRFRNSSRRQVYIYRWNRMERKGQRCIVHVRGSMNSCLIEFEDGYQAVTSRNALKKL